MKRHDITASLLESCPFCLSKAHNPIFTQNYKRCLDSFFLTPEAETKINTVPHFSECLECHAIFRNKAWILPDKEEHDRYYTHENSLKDPQYIKYLSESIHPFLKFIESEEMGLDYGCGPVKGLEGILGSKGYNIQSYDKYFHPGKKPSTNTFDFIFCHEVIEHFVNFKTEITELMSLLKPKGRLFIRTELHPNNLDIFERWYYKNDSTHVFFLSLKTFELIAKTYNCTFTQLDKNKFILQKIP